MSLELIIGPMFAGKSSAALARIRRAKVLGWNCCLITSSIDTRYDTSGASINTHDKDCVPAIGVKMLAEVLTLGSFHQSRLVIIEEAQFFSDLYDVVKSMVESYSKDVIVIGLDGCADRKPFGQILNLIPIADTITKLTALCKRCGNGTVALFSALVKGEKAEQVCVGGADKYEPMCRQHYLAMI